MIKLLFELHPEHGESIRGFILRLSEANLYQTPYWFKDLTDFPEYIRQIVGASLFGRGPSWLCLSNRKATMPNGLSDYFVLGEKTRFCPACLKENRFWRLEWEHAFYTVCHRHHVGLVDRCPRCRSYISWKRSRLLNCQCGADLTISAQSMATSAEVALCHLLAASINCESKDIESGLKKNNLPINLQKVSAQSLASLIYTLGAHASSNQRKRSPRLYKTSHLSEAQALIQRTSNVLVNWPNNFYAFLREYGKFDNADSCNQEPPVPFKRLSQAIRAEFGVELEFIQTAYREFIRTHWLGVLSHRHRWATQEDRDNQRFISGTVAARILGVSRERVKYLLDKSILKGYARCTQGDRIFIFVERESLSAAEIHLGTWIGRENVIQMLGISNGRLDDLIHGGLVKVYVHKKNGTEVKKFSRFEITALVKQFSLHIRELGLDEEYLSAQAILKARLDSDGEFAMFVQAVLEGKLSTVGLDEKYEGVSALMFSLCDFVTWQKELRNRPKDSLTVVEAADALEVKEEVAYHLVRSGFLPSRIIKLWGRKQREVRREDIISFQENYISAIALAKAWETSPKVVLEILGSRGIRPVIGPKVDGCRQYFFTVLPIVESGLPIFYHNAVTSSNSTQQPH